MVKMMITEKDFNEKVIADANKLKGYKISYTYWAFPTLNYQNMEEWFDKIKDKFSKSNGTIQIIESINGSTDTDFHTLDYWNLPNEYIHIQETYKKKVDEYLKYFGGEFERNKNSYTNNGKREYIKFIFAPIVEIENNNEIVLYFVNANIYGNGVVGIELIEDLNSLELSNDLHNIKSKYLKDKFSPILFASNKRIYKSSEHSQMKQQDDLIKNIKFQTKKLSQGIKISDEHVFSVMYITNLNEINNESNLYKNIKIENILINSPIIKWEDETQNEDLEVPIYKNAYIKYLHILPYFVFQ